MPDLIADTDDHIIWPDELCASCLNTGSCPLLITLHKYNIQTYSGVHVFRCDGYEADVSSPYYTDPDVRDPAKQIERNLETLQLEADLLLQTLKQGAPWPSL